MRINNHHRQNKLYIPIYIYIYVYVCVCYECVSGIESANKGHTRFKISERKTNNEVKLSGPWIA